MGTTRILLVEDEKDIRESLQDFLEGEGFDVSSASNGQEALQLLDSMENPDVILLDLMMPIMNGAEFRHEQERKDRIKDIPVVVMSAVNQAKQQADSIGISRHVKKPIDLDDLLTAIKDCAHC